MESPVAWQMSVSFQRIRLGCRYVVTRPCLKTVESGHPDVQRSMTVAAGLGRHQTQRSARPGARRGKPSVREVAACAVGGACGATGVSVACEPFRRMRAGGAPEAPTGAQRKLRGLYRLFEPKYRSWIYRRNLKKAISYQFKSCSRKSTFPCPISDPAANMQ